MQARIFVGRADHPLPTRSEGVLDTKTVEAALTFGKYSARLSE